MKKLHLLFLKAIVGPFVITLFVTNFLFLMIWVWKYLEDWIGKGVGFHVFIELLFYSSLMQAPLSLPLTVLISSIMVYGGKGENNELIAIKSLGISTFQASKSLIVAFILLAGFIFFHTNVIMPHTQIKLMSIQYGIFNTNPELSIPEGVFYNEIDGYSIRVKKKDRETNTLRDIVMYDHSHTLKNNIFMLADSGRFESSDSGTVFNLILYEGNYYKEEDQTASKKHKSYPNTHIKFSKNHQRFAMSGMQFSRHDENYFKDRHDAMSMEELEMAIDSLRGQINERKEQLYNNIDQAYFFRKDSTFAVDTLKPYTADKINTLRDSLLNSASVTYIYNRARQVARGAKSHPNNYKGMTKVRYKNIRKFKSTWHKKITLSVSCIVLFVVGASVGSIIRKGGFGWPVVVAVLIFLFYYVTIIIGEKKALHGSISPFWGIWIGPLLLLPVSIYLAKKANR